MDKMTALVTLIMIFASTLTFGQAKYFKNNSGKIIDSLSYAKIKNEQLQKLKVFSPKAIIKDNFKEVYDNKDSIVYSYQWEIRSRSETQSFNSDKYLNNELPFPNLKTLENKIIGINDLKGKPTLINFWFTTCKPCIEEMPVLNKMKDQFKESINFIAITYEQTKKVRAFLKKHKYNFIQIADAQSFISSLELNSFPVNIFLDKNGKVFHTENGIPYFLNKNKKMIMGDGKDFEDILRELL